jgi:hypothetical protein
VVGAITSLDNAIKLIRQAIFGLGDSSVAMDTSFDVLP